MDASFKPHYGLIGVGTIRRDLMGEMLRFYKSTVQLDFVNNNYVVVN